MSKSLSSKFISLLLIAAAGGGGYLMWKRQHAGDLPLGFAAGNGRIEATEVDIATKDQGRVESVSIKEGDMVEPGQLLAQIDASVLRAQLAEAEAARKRAEADRAISAATSTQRIKEHDLAVVQLKRTQQLFERHIIEASKLDSDTTNEQTTAALLKAAEAQIASADAAIQSADATIQKYRSMIADTELKSPRPGRVEYRLVEPGEVVPAGGKVVTLLDVLDVYMTFYLPTEEAGKVAIGGDARIVLDALPGAPIPATVSFVSPTAQFTPKEVETRSEREKLMFRVKVRIDPELLRPYVERVKTGLPGIAYVRLDASQPWPEHLKTRDERGLPRLIPASPTANTVAAK
jgi:HlyD family secretion protein